MQIQVAKPELSRRNRLRAVMHPTAVSCADIPAAIATLAIGIHGVTACHRDRDAEKATLSASPSNATATNRQNKASGISRTALVASVIADAQRNGASSAQPAIAAPSTISGQASTAISRAANTRPRWDKATLEARKVPDDGPRLYAKTRHVWIYAEPDATKQWIGYLWTGASVKLRSSKPRYGIGCDLFYAIEPRGYVCVDGGRATLDPKDPVVTATFPYAPQTQTPFLHRYGESRGTPIYRSLPTEAEQRFREGDYRAQMARIADARAGKPRHALLVDVDLLAAPEQTLIFPKLSPSIYEAHNDLKPRSTVAYSAEMRHSGRDFLLTSDFRFIPKDRVVPYPLPLFSGLHFESGYRLHAWFRDANRPKWRLDAQGKLVQTDSRFSQHSQVNLTGKTLKQDGVTFLETEDRTWTNSTEAVVPKLAEKTPWGSRLSESDNSPERPKGRATWIEVSIGEGWLLAYEGHRCVFSTLISPGRGGAAKPGRDPLETAATPVGRFAITGKFVSSTMVAPNDYIHSEVPYAQNFTGPYALHSAYWHNRWGYPMSGGCINLSPIDALDMFQWTEPAAPAGWHGTRWLPHLEPATTLIIHR